MRGRSIIVTLLLCVACSGGDNEITPSLEILNSDIKLKSGLTDTIHIKSVGINKLTWSTDNDFSITVNENGIITAKRLGETVVTVSDEKTGLEKTCRVIVDTSYTTYTEPPFLFGSTLKDYLKADVASEYTRIPNTEVMGFLLYNHEKDCITNLKVDFVNDKLKSIVVLIAKEDDFWEYLNERYKCLNASDDILGTFEFLNKEGDVKVTYISKGIGPGNTITYTQAES